MKNGKKPKVKNRDIELGEQNQSVRRRDQIVAGKKDSLVKLRKSETEGILLRSKARWASQGEKVRKYFCGHKKKTLCG